MTSDKLVRISLGGDLICLREETDAVLKKYGSLRYEGYLDRLQSVFAGSDYAIGNLETPISPSAELTGASVRFNTDMSFLEALKAVGFNFFSTANNHCLDRGVVGMEETICSIEKMGFDHDGTFKRVGDSEEIFVKDVGGIRIAICCFTFGTNSQINGEMLPAGEEWRVALLKKQPKFRKIIGTSDLTSGNVATYIADDVSPAAIGNPVNEAYLERALAKVRRAKELADFVIVMPHVGGQYNPGPAAYAKYVVSRFRELDVDMVVAGHPHVPQRCESWNGDGCFVAYSLGNLCFTPNVGYYVKNVLSEYGVVLHAYIGKESKKLERVTFDVVKNIVDEDGCDHVLPVVDIWENEKNVAARDRLQMEVEAVVNRFRGSCDDVRVQSAFEFVVNR